MIREHEFNSRWFGGRVGIVENGEFFANSKAEIRSAWNLTNGLSSGALPDLISRCIAFMTQVSCSLTLR
jgi:hypothetical protein